MSEAAAKLLEQLLSLPEADRLQVADRLWDSLGAADDPTSDPAFRAELQRRLDSIADGTAELIDGELAFAEARAELDRRRAAREQRN